LNIIEINNIKFSYEPNSEKHIVNIIDLCVKEGEQLFIYGPSGSGKSTLLNLICGLHLANSGNINVLGKSLHNMSSRQRDKHRATNIGYIFQQFNLIEYLHAIDNIKLARHFSANSAVSNIDTEIEDILTSLHLDKKDWYRPVNQLSVGQQQRVGIARALINKPKLIIADEPTSSLDQAARDSFIALLLSLCEKHASTLLFVSHDMSLRKHFSSSIALSDVNFVESTH
jgi:putative ABC transport system ATP-binding protein